MQSPLLNQQGALSLSENLGHIDFFPNGGAHQPGCRSNCNILTCPFANLFDLIQGACSHQRAISFYEETLKTEYNDHLPFESHECPSYQDFLNDKCEKSCSWDDHENCAHMGEKLEVGYIQSRLNLVLLAYT